MSDETKIILDNENSAEAVNPLGEEGVFEDISWLDFLKLLNGKDEDGLPKSYASFSIHKLKPGESNAQIANETLLKDAVIHVMTSGGCAVVQADMPRTSNFERKRIMHFAVKWLENADKEFDGVEAETAVLTVMPASLCGSVYVVFENLVYAASFPIENGTRMIFCFDNGLTSVFEDDDVDIEEIRKAVIEELDYEEKLLEDELAALEEEERKLREEENLYSRAIKERLGTINPDNGDVEAEEDEEDYEYDEDNEEEYGKGWASAYRHSGGNGEQGSPEKNEADRNSPYRFHSDDE